MANINTGANFFANDNGFIQPSYGGPVAVMYASLVYTDITATTLFTLPAGAVPVDYTINITTAFNAGSTNTFDVGLGATGDNIANGAAAGTIAVLRAGSTLVSGSTLFTALTADTAVTAVYIPTGGASSAGAMTIAVSYIMTSP